MTTANLSALTWQVYAGNTSDLIAPVLVDLSTYAGISVSPVGAGIGAASIVPATGVVIDNMGGTGDLTVQIGPISTLVPRYQKANLPIANAANPVAFSGSGIKPVAYFYTGTFHGEGGSLNAFASQEAANVASITGGTTDAYLDTITWNINVKLANGYNLDNLNVSGFYDVLNPTNGGTALPGGTWQVDCRVYSGSNVYVYQLARNILSADTEVYERRSLAGNGWSPWRNIGLPATGQCRFQYNSATQCTLVPFNGGQIIVNGNVESIPSAGVTFANQIGTSALATLTLYYAYIYMSAPGVMAGELTLTSYGFSGNGTPIKSGDATRTLVGMIFTDGSAQFQDNNQNRFVASYFNRRPRQFGVVVTAGGRTASTSLVNLGAGCSVLLWGGDTLTFAGFGSIQNDAAGNTGNIVCTVDGTPQTQDSPVYSPAVNAYMPATNTYFGSPSEGKHACAIYGRVVSSSSAGTWNIYLSGVVNI